MKVSLKNAQKIILANTFELYDDNFEYLMSDSRVIATHKARKVNGSTKKKYIARAKYLIDDLSYLENSEETKFSVNGLLNATFLKVKYFIFIWIILFIFGVSLNKIGFDRQINILSFPLMGVIFWNIFVYIALIAKTLRIKSGNNIFSKLILNRLFIKEKQQPELNNIVNNNSENEKLSKKEKIFVYLAKKLFYGTKSKIVNKFREYFHGYTIRRPNRLFRKIRNEYLSNWKKVSIDVTISKIKIGFYTGAIVIVLGTILGMYLRGLQLEYQVVWESTF